MHRRSRRSPHGKRSGNPALHSQRRTRPDPLDAFKTVEAHMEGLLLTPAEAAAALGIGRSKVYELLRAGVLPSVRIGACRRIPADGLTAFVTTLQPAR